jgi:hypothetical protein
MSSQYTVFKSFDVKFQHSSLRGYGLHPKTKQFIKMFKLKGLGYLGWTKCGQVLEEFVTLTSLNLEKILHN